MSKFCPECNHTGLIPFEKDGQVILHAFLDCECREPEMEHYRTIGPEDFDYPLSDTFRAYSYHYSNVPDPYPVREPISELPDGNYTVVHIHQHVYPDKKSITRIKRYD